MSKWYKRAEAESDVVIASKITIARNISGIPFPCRMNNEMRRVVCKKAYASIQNSKLAGEFETQSLDSLTDIERKALLDRSIISPAFSKQRQSGVLLTSSDEAMSIMLCEDDHIKITVRAVGQQLKSIYAKADKIDNIFIDSLNIAFDKRYGFLTSDPTRIGTGVRVALLLHLPAIKGHRMISNLSEMINKLGFSIRETMNGNGDLFELSNEISLGISEENAIDNLIAISDQIVSRERALRGEMLKYSDFEDKLYRAIGTLEMARRLSEDELFSLLSITRAGISRVISDDNGNDNISPDKLNDFLFSLGNATIIVKNKTDSTQAERLRADYIRERLNIN